MSITVQSRVHRTLRKIPEFKVMNEWAALPQLVDVTSPLAADEIPVGIYENVPGQLDQLLVFTDQGFYFREGEKWRNLRYDEIKHSEWPPEPKVEARTLIIRKKTGACEQFPVLGGSLEEGRDLFVVMRFIDRVAKDTDSRRNAVM